MPTICVVREPFIYLFATGKIIRDSKTANLKVNVNILKKKTKHYNWLFGGGGIAVIRGEYTLCCQVTLRKAELKKELRQTCQKGWDRKDVW